MKQNVNFNFCFESSVLKNKCPLFNNVQQKYLLMRVSRRRRPANCFTGIYFLVRYENDAFRAALDFRP